MSRGAATTLRFRSISIVAALAVMTACSSPNHEGAGGAPTAQKPTASTKPARASSRPEEPRPGERAAAEERIPTPPETPVTTAAAPRAGSADSNAMRPEPAPDPVKSMQDAEARRLEYEQSLPRLASERDAAAEVVVRREKDLLAFKNPFRPRPQLAPDEAEEIKGMDGVARVKWAESRLADAKAVLEAAQNAYSDAKANPPSN